jgi:hypothetical protein
LLGTSRPNNGADVKYTGIRETIERMTIRLFGTNNLKEGAV